VLEKQKGMNVWQLGGVVVQKLREEGVLGKAVDKGKGKMAGKGKGRGYTRDLGQLRVGIEIICSYLVSSVLLGFDR
jgi:hypothetical protein